MAMPVPPSSTDRGGRSLQTRGSLARDLTALGVGRGDTLLVHSSLSALGWVCGGSETVVAALLDVLGADGTLVVPTHTMDNTDPAGWQAPPVPADWWQAIREAMPGYDARTAVTRGMGRIPETVRTWPGALRSPHPQASFAAVGPQADAVTGRHPLGSALGDESPLGHLERLGATVLLLGVGYDTCTAFHLGEYRVPQPRRAPTSCAVRDSEGVSTWVTCTDVEVDDEDFLDLGAAFESGGEAVTVGQVGDAPARLFSLPTAVDFATAWLTEHRGGS